MSRIPGLGRCPTNSKTLNLFAFYHISPICGWYGFYIGRPLSWRWHGSRFFYGRARRADCGDPKQSGHKKSSQQGTTTCNIFSYYMTSSVSGQDEPNRALWLATRAGKMERYCPLGISRLVPQDQRSFFGVLSHIINPLLTKIVRSRWLDIGLVLFLRVYGPRLRLVP